MSLIGAINVVGSGMIAQSIRLSIVASNIANHDTIASSEKEAWHKKNPIFKTVMLNAQPEACGVQVTNVVNSGHRVKKLYQPENPVADSKGYIYASNVSRTESLTNMISASQSYQANVMVAKTCKDLLMDVIASIKSSKA